MGIIGKFSYIVIIFDSADVHCTYSMLVVVLRDVFTYTSLKVTTHSRLLSASDAWKIGRALRISREALKVISLQNFNTEHQFSKTLR